MARETKLACALFVSVLSAGIALEAQQAQSDPRSPAAQAATRVRLSMGASIGLLRKRVAPEYPSLARASHVQGTVILNAVVTKAGDVAEVTVTSGDPTLAGAAIKALRKWKYKPYLLQGEPVEFETMVQMNFTLSGR